MREVNYTPPSSSSVFRLGLGILAGLVVAYVLFTAFLLALVRLKSWLAEDRAIYLTDSKSVI